MQRGRTSCGPTVDLSSYWTPTLYDNGKAATPPGRWAESRHRGSAHARRGEST
ncbi:DUF1996 domain-containing protein [Streptomyces antimycoticus]|nr:DUF1996 domain-containing protein [Streptomyces sp. AgN23]QTI90708.1 DUF1996 domain-containing protein [Streptomyces sp. AgN23]WTA86956.1 DUF1996 domain-containing protein [Streptomyces antimycoticus]